MNEDIHRRLNRIYQAFGKIKSDNLDLIKPDFNGKQYRVDFGMDEIEAENYANLLIHNIASIKDHLKDWCTANGQKFNGELLINSNRDVAIIHDLWNIDKHKDLNKPPRSGFKPQIRNLNRSLRLSAQMHSGIDWYVDTRDGKIKTYSEGKGYTNSALVIDGQIVDEHGNKIGSFLSICESAINAWENLLIGYGIPVK